MKFRPFSRSESIEIEALVTSVFTHSEGNAEGVRIGGLVKDLIANTASNDLCGYVATDKDKIVAAIFFSRLTFKNMVNAFILSPVAVHVDYQGRGIAQALINHGLQELRRRDVSLVTTYGDPSFYSKVGFRPLSQDVVKAPLPLSQPEGWLGQSLASGSVTPISGGCSCVQALNNPVFW